ncbi:hypothetical protein GTP56_03405 [Duganella sp. FT134W]|uniref:Uncharacterized protein n=1 Tax=Duganella margarita TaxID=2692170 RepID=A0A7X4KED3_9BURK|nr:hypothetical protein [Duganella margarita]MYM71241.1 hypothetical protein [Duganella margarita]
MSYTVNKPIWTAVEKLGFMQFLSVVLTHYFAAKSLQIRLLPHLVVTKLWQDFRPACRKFAAKSGSTQPHSREVLEVRTDLWQTLALCGDLFASRR